MRLETIIKQVRNAGIAAGIAILHLSGCAVDELDFRTFQGTVISERYEPAHDSVDEFGHTYHHHSAYSFVLEQVDGKRVTIPIYLDEDTLILVDAKINVGDGVQATTWWNDHDHNPNRTYGVHVKDDIKVIR